MKKFLKDNWPIIALVFFGIFFRSFNSFLWFNYSHDQDLLGWIIRDVLENGHLRLVGQETTSKGVFIGPLFYYLQIPFYLISKMDPGGGLILPILLGGFGVYSYYYIFSKIFNKKTGLAGALVYAFSNYVIFTDREVVPTMPVMIWGAWFFYSLNLIIKGNKNGWILGIGLLGLTWHLNLALAILSPLLIVSWILSQKKISLKGIVFGMAVFVFLMLPFFAFEARHGYSQTRAIALSLFSSKDSVEGVSKGYAKLDRVMQLVRRNASGILTGDRANTTSHAGFWMLFLSLIFFGLKRRISSPILILAAAWQLSFIVFFSINSLNPSEYYINGMNVIWIMTVALGTVYIFDRFSKIPGLLILCLFVAINLNRFFNYQSPRNGYLEKMELTDYISKDAGAHGYPCISVSYITSPGNDMGYRYFFYLKNMHVNQPKSGSPVYTVVFPESKVSRTDKNFGSLGLVLPDYERYTKKGVEISCSGENSNLTDPMFGFVK